MEAVRFPNPFNSVSLLTGTVPGTSPLKSCFGGQKVLFKPVESSSVVKVVLYYQSLHSVRTGLTPHNRKRRVPAASIRNRRQIRGVQPLRLGESNSSPKQGSGLFSDFIGWNGLDQSFIQFFRPPNPNTCLLYTSDAADE